MKRIARGPTLSRPLFLTLSATALLSLVDFFTRVAVWREADHAEKNIVLPADLPPVESVDQVLNRLKGWIPLDSTASSPASVSADSFILRGVFVGRAGSRAILALRGPDGQITRHLRAGVGDEIEGWRVSAIQPRTVVVEREGVTHELTLFRSGSSSGGGV